MILTLYCMCRQQTVLESELHEVTTTATMSQFSVSSLLHAGRRECRRQTDFLLPYDLYWLKQHGMVSVLQFLRISSSSSSSSSSCCCCLVVIVLVAWYCAVNQWLNCIDKLNNLARTSRSKLCCIESLFLP